MTRIALVEPFLGGSHQAWAEGYAEHSAFDVEVFGLPARHWKWRMQGGHVTLAPTIAEAAADGGPFDVLLASDMTHLAGLIGLLRRHRDVVGDPAALLYLHENQLTFPREAHDDEDLSYAMINWTSMLAADGVVFNSRFHRDEWFTRLPQLLRRFPDHRHAGRIADVAERAAVVPVGVDLAAIDAVPRSERPRPLVLWNQRWQWDKGPDRFLRAIGELIGRGLDFDVAIAGDRGSVREHDDELRRTLGDRLVHDGWLRRDAYLRLLRSADIVISTARHEFFGVSIVEAIRAGAFPVLPDDLAYPEHIDDAHATRCLYRSGADLVAQVSWAVDHRDEARRVVLELAAGLDEYGWPVVAAELDRLVSALVSEVAVGG